MPSNDLSPQATAGFMSRPYLLERVDDAALVQLYADGFTALPVDQKILIWHLYEAAIAGRDIYTDQRYVHNLAMRDFLESLVLHDAALPADVAPEIWRYTKLFWINSGPFNNLTSRKFTLKLPAVRRGAPSSDGGRRGARRSGRSGTGPASPRPGGRRRRPG